MTTPTPFPSEGGAIPAPLREHGAPIGRDVWGYRYNAHAAAFDYLGSAACYCARDWTWGGRGQQWSHAVWIVRVKGTHALVGRCLAEHTAITLMQSEDRRQARCLHA